MSKVYAGVVTYNPEIKRLKENISSIQNQVTTVVIFDNGSNNVDNIQKLILGLANVVFIKSEKISSSLLPLNSGAYKSALESINTGIPLNNI